MKRKRSPNAEEEVSSSRTKTNDLEQLIEERKQEKRKVLKEKLQQKLKTIRDRRTSGGNNDPNPFPKGTFECLKSNDILGNILEYLTDPNDVTNTYFTCRTFAEKLEGRRIHMELLPKVLDVFKRKFDQALESQDEDEDIENNACYQNWHTICSNGRKVCKAWKEAIDYHFDIALDYWHITRNWTDDNNPRTNRFSFEDAESVDEETSFIRRGLEVSPIRNLRVILRPRMTAIYYRKLVDYLKTHGGSVRFLYIDYYSPDIITPGVYGRLCNMLKYMKNLKKLDFSFNNHEAGTDYEEVPESDDDDFEDVHVEHEQELNGHTLPALKSLDYFSCTDWEVNESMISQILRKYINLKSLDLNCTNPVENETTKALMRLTLLERFTGWPDIITSNEFPWPLKHLEINRGMPASVLFPAINRFQETLEELRIWYVTDPIEMDVNDIRLDLPHLKLFYITELGETRGMGFDNLLKLQSLEKVMVGSVDGEDENAKVKVQMYLDSGKMDKSNVWQCFPYLTCLRIGYRKQCFLRPS